VGQLATDLIIASWQSQKVGYLDDPHILPCVGNDPFEDLNKGELSVALEGKTVSTLVFVYLLSFMSNSE
jgi:proteasome assembly chaperone 2